MFDFSADTPALDAIQSILECAADRSLKSRVLVLTCAPEIWSHSKLADLKCADVSMILPKKSVFKWRDAESHLLDEMEKGGWPKDTMVVRYKTFDTQLGKTLKSNVAIFDLSGGWLIGVLIRPSSQSLFEKPSVSEAFALATRKVKSTHTLITDGAQYHYINIETGDYRVFKEIPTPELLGLNRDLFRTAPNEQMKDLAYRSDKFDSDEICCEEHKEVFQEDFAQVVKVRPTSPSLLDKFAKRYQPSCVILDFSIPLSSSVAIDESNFHNTPINLIADLAPLERLTRLAASEALLLWAANLEGIESIAALVSTRFSNSSHHEWFRKYLDNKIGLFSNVEFPSSVLKPVRNEPSNLIVLSKKNSECYFDWVRAKDISDQPFAQSWYTSQLSWLRGEPTNRGFKLSRPLQDSWDCRTLSPDYQQVVQSLSKIGKLSELGELCSLRAGQQYKTESVESGVRVIRPQDIADGIIQPSSTSFCSKYAEIDLLQDGDVLLPRFATEKSTLAIFRGSETSVVSSHLWRIRPNKALISSEYLASFLNSTTGKTVIKSWSSSVGSLVELIGSRVKSIPIPLIDNRYFENFAQIFEIESTLRNESSQVRSLQQSLFEADSSSVFLERLNEIRRVGKLLSLSLSLAKNVEFQIANFYPYPISYGFRLLASNTNIIERYREQLRFGESFLAFIGSVCLTLLKANSVNVNTFKLREKWQGGISPGDWKEIFRLFKNDANLEFKIGTAIVSELEQLCAKAEFGADLNAIIKCKNDFKHDRGPSNDREYLICVNDIEKRLFRCMTHVAFFTECALRQVKDIDVDRSNTKYFLRCLRIMGDHPGFMLEDMEHSTALKKGDLFISDHESDWIPLFPFIVSEICSTCGSSEVFFVDGLDSKKQVAFLKSFERGHSIESSDIFEALDLWLSST